MFGELGRQIDNVKRAWETCVLKAHGHEPVWQKSALAPASRGVLKAIDLHFHDLHEGESRLHEAGWPLHHVQEMLGHASLEHTSTYLNVARGGLRGSMAKSDEARSRCNSVVHDAAIEHPTPYNDGGENAHKSTIN